MCQEVFKIVQEMDKKHIETKLALQCAPLITGIKISNLLIVSTEDEANVRTILKRTGISHYRLLRQDNKTTYLLFHRSKLSAYLQDSEVQDMLSRNGYEKDSLGQIMRRFQKRYETYMSEGEQFPHEMGLLLGYPVEDVVGFMENNGKNYLYSGYWKVYSDVSKKRALFKQYEDSVDDVIRLLDKGIGIRLIIEAYRLDVQRNKQALAV